MKYIVHTLLTIALILSVSAIGLAQQTRRGKARPSSIKKPRVVAATKGCIDYVPIGPISNERTLSKPAPDYPEEARAKNISGRVVVQVIIDTSGHVTFAHAVSGPPMLLQAAVDAAYRARFLAIKLSGQPIKAMGQITYDFVL